ncbi:MAG: hypothetical protein ACM31C_15405 [Acidobacteriota bacterium]
MGRAWLVAVVCTATAAHAGTTLPGGGTIAFGGLYLHEDGNPQLAPAADPARYFNLAHCACSQLHASGPSFVERTFAYELSLAGAPVDRPLELWVGAACDDDAARAAGCHRVTTIADLATLATPARPELGVWDVMEPEPAANVCDFRALASAEWAIADGDGDGVYDYFASAPVAADALAPPLPTGFVASPQRSSIDLAWTPPDDLSDIVAYQVFCATRGAGEPASTRPPPAPRYTTARALCGLSYDVPLHPSAIDTGFPPPDDIVIPQGIAQLDPAFLCADVPDPTATGVTLEGLQTREPNMVMLVAVDAAGNASATYFTSYLVMSSKDWWTDLGDRGDRVDGGFGCDAGGGGGGLVAVMIAAVSMRRRRYPRTSRDRTTTAVARAARGV